MTPWVRLWREMPHDPKFRAIAKKAGRPVSDVIAVFITMMTSADEDGCIGSWDADDTAAGLDLDTSIVIAIRDAMVGKVIEGNALMGWKKRQPKRDDDSRERVRAFRERKREETQRNEACNAPVTHGNAPDTDSETDTERKDTPLPPLQGGGPDPVKLYELISANSPKPAANSPDPIAVQAAFEAYNTRALMLGLPQASRLTPDRRRRIGARLREWGDDGWSRALANLDCPFLRGMTDRGFRADLDFVCQPKSFARLHDGGYAHTGASHGTDRQQSQAGHGSRLQRAADAIRRSNAAFGLPS